MPRASTRTPESPTVNPHEIVVALAHAAFTNAATVAIIHARRHFTGDTRVTVFAEALSLEAMPMFATRGKTLAVGARDPAERMLTLANAILTHAAVRAFIGTLPLITVQPNKALVAVALAIDA